ncbi:hypothetical protein ACE01N_01060 [Saccharicrinis sp. FJH2]|uniref:hypothetical protein n=1 Tax=Saccharicrinis sp. FJH65 TaxID=3344659 RepID=UPI0035F33CCB
MKTFKTGLITKFLLLIGLVFLPALSNGQIKLSQSMSPGGTFGLVDVNELKGGFMMVDNLEQRDSIFMNRTKRGLMVVVIDADDIQAGDQTKTYMFLPSEDPVDYSDGGKIWNTYDEYSVHMVSQFMSKYSLTPWVEVSLGLKDPNGPGIDTIFISTSFIDTIYSNTGDTLFLMDKVKTDSLYADYLDLSGVQILGISTDETFANASNDSLVTQLAIKTYVQNELANLSTNANISNLSVDTLTADTAFISRLLNNTLVSDSINVDTLIALYSTIDTAAINKVSVNYFTLNGYWVGSISNDTLFTSADSTALITEFAVQNRIDSVMVYVNDQFSNLSQNSIENPVNSATKIVVNENDSLVFTVNGDTAMVINPDGTVVADTLSVQQLTLSGDTITGISTDVNLGGIAASDDSLSTQLAVKTYVDTEIAKLSGSTTTDTLRANVAYINQANLDTIVADTAYITELKADTLVADRAEIDTLYMDSDTIFSIAKTGDTVADSVQDNTLVTAGYVKNNASAFPDGLNPITRAGWSGVSGQDLNADNVVDFLKKVFFPVPEPQINDFRYDATYRSYETAPGGDPNGALTETISPTLQIPYATWKNSAFTLALNYDIDNRSALDANITTTNIATVNLISAPGTFNQTDNINNANANITGSFTVNKADFGAPSATVDNNYTFTLTVTDDYPNVNTLTFPVLLKNADPLTISYFRINGGNGPITVEGDGTDKAPVFSWSINTQEDTVTSITLVQELPSSATYATGSTSATGTYNHTITAPAGQGTYTYRYDLRVGSEVFGSNVNTNVNRQYIITDRHFWGYIYLTQKQAIDAMASGTAVDLSAFFPDAPSRGNVLNKDWEGSQPNAGIASGASVGDGVAFSTTTSGDVYACIAIPRTTGSVELHQWDDLNKYWVDQSGLVAKPVTYTVGSLTKNYWLVYSTTAFSSTAAPIFRVVEK